MNTEKKEQESTEQALTIPVVSGSYYWVKTYKDRDYEPAKCRDYYGNGKMYFCFTSGGIMEVSRVQDYKELNYR